MAFRFKNFDVYQNARQYAQYCQGLVGESIRDRRLADQILRASNSIVLNNAERSTDLSDIEFARFLGISVRSVYETVAGFDLARAYGLIDENANLDVEGRAENLVKQLSAFRSTLLKGK